MRLENYLDELNWTQTRLAQEAKISVSTVGRLIQDHTISRINADKVCETLTRALGRTIKKGDIDEMNVPAVVRPERRKNHKDQQGDQNNQPAGE
jgi:transcriptional regulator with XRE-family HTH domain